MACCTTPWPANSREKRFAEAQRATLDRLEAEIQALDPATVVLLGDSFHDSNGPSRLLPEALDLLLRLLRAHDWLWVTGNHDGDSGVEIGGRRFAVGERIAMVGAG